MISFYFFIIYKLNKRMWGLFLLHLSNYGAGVCVTNQLRKITKIPQMLIHKIHFPVTAFWFQVLLLQAIYWKSFSIIKPFFLCLCIEKWKMCNIICLYPLPSKKKPFTDMMFLLYGKCSYSSWPSAGSPDCLTVESRKKIDGEIAQINWWKSGKPALQLLFTRMI